MTTTTTNSSMAKRSKPSSSDSDEDAPEKKKSRTTTAKQVSNGGGSSTIARIRGAKPPAVSAATNKNTIETAANPQTSITSASSAQVVSGGNKGSVTSFLKSARLTKSQPPHADTTKAENTNANTPAGASKSDTKKNDLPSQDLNTDISRRKSGVLLSACLFAANVASAAYIFSQHTVHNLAQMRCASTVNKLQLELSDSKDEMKLLRKAIETLEGRYTNANIEGMKTIFGSSLTEHKQFLTSDELLKWKQWLNALEEERLSTMNDFNENRYSDEEE